MIGYIILFCSILGIDLITKQLALWYAPATVSINRGISWSMFHSHSDLIFWSVSTLVLIFVLAFAGYTLGRLKRHEFIGAEVIVLGGSCANLLSRLLYAGVVDFIGISAYGYQWPLLNIADVVIVLGVFWIMIREYWRP